MRDGRTALLVSGGAGLSALLWYLQAGAGRSLATAAVDGAAAVTGRLVLSAAQRNMVQVITRVFQARGYGWLVKAAVANAYAESRLDPRAVGDNGASVGLFQLNRYGAGAGMSVAQRMDPERNADRILDVAIAEGVDTHRQADDVYLTEWFARYAENCAACGGPWAIANADGDASDLPRRVRILGALWPTT